MQIIPDIDAAVFYTVTAFCALLALMLLAPAPVRVAKTSCCSAFS